MMSNRCEFIDDKGRCQHSRLSYLHKNDSGRKCLVGMKILGVDCDLRKDIEVIEIELKVVGEE